MLYAQCKTEITQKSTYAYKKCANQPGHGREFKHKRSSYCIDPFTYVPAKEPHSLLTCAF